MTEEEIQKKADEFALNEVDESLKNYSKPYQLASSVFNGIDVSEGFYQGVMWALETMSDELKSKILPKYLHGGDIDCIIAEMEV
jgi:hypothetical protein